MDWVAYLSGLLEQNPYLVLWVSLVICGMGLPVPEELIFFTAGYVGRKFGADPFLLCATGLAGILTGDMIPYFVGRYYGDRVLDHPFVRRMLPPRARAQVEEFFASKGARTIFIARFLAGLRTPTFMIAGAMRTRLSLFLFWDMLGALISCPACVLLAFYFGEPAKAWIAQSHALVVAVVVIAGVMALMKFLRWRQRLRAESKLPPMPDGLTLFVYHLVWVVVYGISRLIFRLRVEGAENISHDGRVILVANHASFADPIFLALATPRFVQYLMYKTFYYSFGRPLFAFLCAVPIDESDYLDALKTGQRLLEQEVCLGVFPEGAVSYDGTLLPARTGALMLARRTGTPVVPVTIKGNHRIFPRGAWFPRFRRLTLVVGTPRAVDRRATREDMAETMTGIMREIARNLEQPYNPAPPTIEEQKEKFAHRAPVKTT